MFARGYAFIAGFDTTFVVFRLHNVSPFFCFCIRERRVAMGHYRGLCEDSAPPQTDPAESCLSSHCRILPARRVDATRTSFVFTHPVLRTLSRSNWL